VHNTHIVVLAAGKGTRMKSRLPKVLHAVAGRPMIEYVLDVAASQQPASVTVVVGHQAEMLRGALRPRANLRCVVQEPQLGTGHALLATAPALAGATGTLILLSGDVPLLTEETLQRIVDTHVTADAAATVGTAVVSDPTGYGRIVRAGEQIARIVEERDATPSERDIHEINTGIYAFALDGLFESLRSIASDNAQREYYLPDLVAIYRRLGLNVATVTVPENEIRGVNSRQELADVSRAVRLAKCAELMAAGVTIDDPSTTYIDRDVQIGADTVIHPGVTIEGATRIGSGCTIHSWVRIVDSAIGERVTINNFCVLTNASIGEAASVGPFAHLRNEATLDAQARVGNFVELKKTTLGAGSKAMHLAYLGDASIGSGVNIGAGTITCNYDGEKKNQTTIEDGAFIGSDTQLVAPVTVGQGAYVGSGSTIRENVPPGSLAVSAGKQRNIEGWVEKRKRKRK